MSLKIGRQAYAEMFGPTTGDRVRLADTELWIEVEKDYTHYGEEVKFGGGKVIRDGMGQSQRASKYTADTVITNALTLMNELRATNGITLLGLGGLYYNWCSAFMGPMTRHEIAQFHADTFIMSTSAIINDVVFHQHLETLDTKRAMFDASNKRVLLADHTKFERHALHAMVPLRAFDAVIVDDGTSRMDIEHMRNKGINVVVAATPHTHRITHDAHRGTEERSK